MLWPRWPLFPNMDLSSLFHLLIVTFCFATGSNDGVVKVWDIRDGSLLLTVPEAGEEIGKVTCCCDDDIIVASSKSGISAISFETGEILHR